MAIPLDEFPVHQVPLSMAHVGSSDRNAYDRSYFNAHDRTGDIFLVTGMGVYPEPRSYRCVRHRSTRGNSQVTVRASDALRDDRMRQEVGPFRVEVIDPLQRIRMHLRGRVAWRRVRSRLGRVVSRDRRAVTRHPPSRQGDTRCCTSCPGRDVERNAARRRRRDRGDS